MVSLETGRVVHGRLSTNPSTVKPRRERSRSKNQ